MVKYYVYVLELKDNKFYVGTTELKPEFRILEHVAGEGKGSYWTRKYPPIGIYTIKECPNEISRRVTERLITFELMKSKGYNMIRGANYCQLRMMDIRDLEHLSYDICQLCKEDPKILMKTLRPKGPRMDKYTYLLTDGKSKYFR